MQPRTSRSLTACGRSMWLRGTFACSVPALVRAISTGSLSGLVSRSSPIEGRRDFLDDREESRSVRCNKMKRSRPRPSLPGDACPATLALGTRRSSGRARRCRRTRESCASTGAGRSSRTRGAGVVASLAPGSVATRVVAPATVPVTLADCALRRVHCAGKHGVAQGNDLIAVAGTDFPRHGRSMRRAGLRTLRS